MLPKAYLAVVENALGKTKPSTVSDETIRKFYNEVKKDADEATEFVLQTKGFRPNIVALVYFLCLRQGALTTEVLSFLTQLRDMEIKKGTPAHLVLARALTQKKNFNQRVVQSVIFWVVNRLLEGKAIKNLLEEPLPLSIHAPSPKSPTRRRAKAAAAGR
jgi:hypothetical protein